MFLDRLVADDPELQHNAFLAGSISAIADALCHLIPESNPVWLEDEEPTYKSELLEVSVVVLLTL